MHAGGHAGCLGMRPVDDEVGEAERAEHDDAGHRVRERGFSHGLGEAPPRPFQ